VLSDRCVSCQLFRRALTFAVFCGETIHPTAKATKEMHRIVGSAILGTRRYNFQPPTPTLSARIHNVTDGETDGQTTPLC